MMQKLLVSAIESRNLDQFQEILTEYQVNPNIQQNCLDKLSIFEKVLQTPNSGKLIEICFRNGSNFYKVISLTVLVLPSL